MSVGRHPIDEALAATFPPGVVFAVGGRVRDDLRAAMAGIVSTPKDLDYVVVGLAQDEVEARLRRIGRVDVVGASFAVLKFRADAGEADIALPRRERSTGAGHRDFAIESGPEIPLEDDLSRRDFRMNMIARRIDDDAIVDPYGGVADIQARRIDIVAEATFRDDPLRLLRAAQFAARFGFTPTDRTVAAMTDAAALVTTVSGERIGDEITKLLGAPQPSVGIELLRTTGVLTHLWPELLEGVGVEQNQWHAYDVYRHALATMDAAPAGDPVLRLAALLHDVGKPRTAAPRPDGRGNTFYSHEIVGADMVPAMLGRLRSSTETVEAITRLVRHHMYAADPQQPAKTVRRFVRRVGAGHLPRLFALRHADVTGSGLPEHGPGTNAAFEARVAAVLAERPPLGVTDLAIGGAEIIALLVARGLAAPDFRGDRRVGTVLAALLEEVLDDPARNEAGFLTAAANRHLDEHFVTS
jgi:putative nucleotidyltransferase with HDIG domain